MTFTSRVLGSGGGHDQGREPVEVEVCGDAVALDRVLPALGPVAVDFASEQIVVIRARCADTSWYLVLAGVTVDEPTGDVTVSFRRETRGGVALQVITRPWLAVAISRTQGAVHGVDATPPPACPPAPPPARVPPRAPAPIVTPPSLPAWGLVARWRDFGAAPRFLDETGRFTAVNLGMVPVTIGDRGALAWRADGHALRLPESVLDARAAGALVLHVGRAAAGTAMRLFGKVDPGVVGELGVHLAADDRLSFAVGPHRPLATTVAFPVGAARRLVLAWGPEGRRVFVDGALVADDAKPAAVGRRARITELGRDPNQPDTTGSRGFLLEVAVYEGIPPDATTLAGL